MNTETVRKVPERKQHHLYWILPICLIFAGLFFTMGASAYTSRTEFCMTCHEMESAVSSWQMSVHAQNDLGITAECKDCHIPRGMVNMMFAKADKLSELYVHVVESPTKFQYNRMRPELTRRARKKIPDENCLACHDLTRQEPQNQTQQIAHSTAVGTAKCVSCHQVGHSPQKSEGEGDIR